MHHATTAPPAHGPFLSGGGETYHLSWRAAAIVAVYAGALLLVSLGGGTRVFTYHEVLFAQPAKEMLATGNWILPKFADIPSTHKPPGAHWAIALIMALTGSEAEGVVRIPSALAGIAAAVLVALLAARWFGGRVGLVAGLAQVTMYYSLQLGRLAECDMLMTLAVIGAMGTFAAANVDSPRGMSSVRWLPWLFHGCAALSYFFKGLIGPAFIFSGCGAYVLLQRDRRGLRFLLNPAGLAGFLALTLGWFWAACSQHPPLFEDQVMHHFGRFHGQLGGEKNSFFYLYSPLLITLPWAPLIMWGVVQGIRRGLHVLPWWKFAACWMLPGLFLLNLSSFKSKHYAAPLMPPLTIVAAMVLLAWLRTRPFASRRSLALASVAGLAGCGLSAAAMWRFLPLPQVEKQTLLLLMALGAVGVTVVISCQVRGRTSAALSAVFGTAGLVVLIAMASIMPHHDSYRGQAEFSAEVKRWVPDGAPCYLLGLEESQITYYLRQPLQRCDSLPALRAVASAGEERFVLAPLALREQLAADGAVEVLGAVPLRPKQQAHEPIALYRLRPFPELARNPADPRK